MRVGALGYFLTASVLIVYACDSRGDPNNLVTPPVTGAADTSAFVQPAGSNAIVALGTLDFPVVDRSTDKCTDFSFAAPPVEPSDFILLKGLAGGEAAGFDAVVVATGLGTLTIRLCNHGGATGTSSPSFHMDYAVVRP